MANHVEAISGAPAYGRFSRRLQAVLIDWMIFLLLMAAALSVATALQSDDVGRILGFTFVVLLLLYEPVLVPLTGGTIGHYLRNLRVVDDRTNGNIGILKAVARALIKSVLGVYSFVTMGTTLRHQALHDVLTRSTVQIRDLSKARPSQYLAPRTELLNPGMPSVGRRSGSNRRIPDSCFRIGHARHLSRRHGRLPVRTHASRIRLAARRVRNGYSTASGCFGSPRP